MVTKTASPSETSTCSEDKTLSFQTEDETFSSGQSGFVGRSTRQFSNRASLLALEPNKRKVNDLSDLTVDKLRFASLGLYGRDDEISTLMGIFDRLLKDSSAQRRLCLISGTSGTGKTRLAETLKDPVSRCNGLFVKGKFDFNLRNQPYSGISNACGEICGAVLRLQQDNDSRGRLICDEIEQTVANELALLVQTIPMLAEIIHLSALEEQNTTSVGSLSTNESKNRIHFAFIRFMRIIAKHFYPFIFVLDDLQWADASSLDLLEVLLADRQNPKFMVIGIYRSNEVDETHTFNRCLEDLEKKSIERYFILTHLQIHDLSLKAVNTIIQDLLACEESRTLGLAEICYNKTHGNPFYLLHFLSMLHENHLLQYNFGTLSWIWNNEEIELITRASDNVVDLLHKRMMELPNCLLEILKIAACLGSTFDQRNLQIVWAKLLHVATDSNSSIEDLDSGIEQLVKEELLVKVFDKPPRYSWVHDKIHEAAIALVPTAEQGAYFGQVGGILSRELASEELNSAIFIVVDLLNSSSNDILDSKARLTLSHLNLQASEKAISLSAFESAAKYAGKGITLLPSGAWDDHYDLCLQLYTIGAKSEGFVGNVAVMEQHCNMVLAQENRPIEDKFDVYNTLIDSMTNRCQIDAAAKLLLEILGKFKCRFPNNAVIVALGLMRNIFWIKGTMKSRETSKLGDLQDDTKVQLIQLLDKLVTCMYMMKDDRLPLVVFRSLNWTIKYGNCAYAPPAFATTGMILTGLLDDIQGGSKYGQHSLSLLHKLQSISTASRTMLCVYSFLLSWTQQSRTVLKPLLEAYDLGLRTGDVESALWAIYHWLTLRHIIGTALESMEADSSLYFKQMNDLKRDQAVKITKCLRQSLLNLMDENNSDDPTRLFGDALSAEDFKLAKDDTFWKAAIWFYQGMLFTYFGEHARQVEMILEFGHDFMKKAHVASPNIMFDTFLKGVSCFEAARSTGKRKYAQLGKLCRSYIKKWLDMGNPNVKHYDTFLDAEWLALKGKKFSAIKHFEVAILQSARGGYQHDAALASELLGEYQMIVMKNKDEAAYRLREAEKYWRGWGALAKVRHLERKYPDIFRPLESWEIFALSNESYAR